MTQTDPISAATVYRTALTIISNARSLSAAVREAQHALEYTFTPPEDGEISIVGGFGSNTRVPFLTIVTPQLTNQVEIEAAREIAENILSECAMAEADGMLFTFFADEMHFELPMIAGLIGQLRDYRARFRADLDHQPPPDEESE